MLLIPTFFGTTFLVFFILQIAPSGPFEQALLDIKQANMQSGEAGSSSSENFGETEISPEILAKLKREYGLDKSIFTRYLIWLGFAKKELEYREIPINNPFKYTIGEVGTINGIPISLQKWIIATIENDEHIIYESISGTDFPIQGYKTIEKIDLGLEENWSKSDWKIDKKLDSNSVAISLEKRQGVFTGYLGESTKYKESVGKLLWERIHISSFLGITGFLLSYLVCIPLGIKKAVNDGSRFDIISSTIVLIGYSIPGFVLGIGLIVLLGGGSFFDIFPTRGLVSDDWSNLSVIEKILDYLWHITLPIICLIIGSFAVMTMLTKNSFIDEINKLYTVTARAKGLSENKVLYSHVFKNAIIPILTGFPAQFVSAFFTGSILIETIFSLDGIGLLSYEAIIQRDYPVVMGTLFIFTLIGLLTKLITDIMYVYVDPRIKFTSSNTQRNL